MPRHRDGTLVGNGASVLRRRWAVIAAAVAVAATAAMVLSISKTPIYAADVEVLIQPRGSGEVLGGGTVSLDERAVRTEIEVIESDAVRSRVTNDLELDSEPPGAEARVVGDTDVVSITVRSPSAQHAQVFAEAYANSYIEFRREQAVTQLLTASAEVEGVISDLTERIDASSDGDPERASLESQRAMFVATLDQLRVDAALQTGGAAVIKPASIPDSPSEPTPLRTTALAGLAGLVIGLVAAFVLERLDGRVRSVGQLEELTDRPLLGRIPLDPPTGQGPLALTAYGRPSVEAYRDLRTNLGVLLDDASRRVIQITSAVAGEGKTVTATNLAVVLAQAGHRVALVDADLRRPRVHDAFGVSLGPGVTDLIHGASPRDVVQYVDVGSGERLSIFTSGALPPNPSEILSGRRMGKLLTGLGERYDHVVVDSVPVLPITDSVALAAVVDCVVVVSLAGSVTTSDVEETIRRLGRVDARVVGFVLNHAPRTSSALADDGADAPASARETAPRDESPDAGTSEGTPDEVTSDENLDVGGDSSEDVAGDNVDGRKVPFAEPPRGARIDSGGDDAGALLADA